MLRLTAFAVLVLVGCSDATKPPPVEPDFVNLGGVFVAPRLIVDDQTPGSCGEEWMVVRLELDDVDPDPAAWDPFLLEHARGDECFPPDEGSRIRGSYRATADSVYLDWGNFSTALGPVARVDGTLHTEIRSLDAWYEVVLR